MDPSSDPIAIDLALPRDYPGMVRLMQANQKGELSEEERRQGGYLSASFTEAQIAEFAAKVPLVVARDGDDVVGFAVLMRTDGADHPPLERDMIATFPRARFAGRALDRYGSVVSWGPVCVDRRKRGAGLLRRMHAKALATLAGRFEVGVSLVADGNPRSLHAHVDGLGMENVGTFESDGILYHLLAFAIPPAPPVGERP